jgi:hypothetical protein
MGTHRRAEPLPVFERCEFERQAAVYAEYEAVRARELETVLSCFRVPESLLRLPNG